MSTSTAAPEGASDAVVSPGRVDRSDRVTAAHIRAARAGRGETVLLFLTDRCPVGCAHCSVDSRPDSPTVTDRRRLEGLVEALRRPAGPWLVGISGGEPFVERWGLTYAVTTLRAAGKRVAVVTSGNWGTATIPTWIHAILADIDTLVLSSDTFHGAQLPDERFVRAAQAAAAAGCWIVVQVVGDAESVADAERLVALAFGADAPRHCELELTTLLDMGRARDLPGTGDAGTPVQLGRRRLGRDFLACGVLGAPVVRYDGAVTPCCNEAVSTGAGPASLHRLATSATELERTLEDIAHDPLLGLVGSVGLGALTDLGGLTDLAEQRFDGICDLCWAVHERAERDPAVRASIDRLALLAALRSTTDITREADA